MMLTVSVNGSERDIFTQPRSLSRPKRSLTRENGIGNSIDYSSSVIPYHPSSSSFAFIHAHLSVPHFPVSINRRVQFHVFHYHLATKSIETEQLRSNCLPSNQLHVQLDVYSLQPFKQYSPLPFQL